MAYCVRCGVELEKGTPACPLCQTRVMDPTLEESAPAQPSQPERVEAVIDRMDRAYGRRLSVILLLVPILTVSFLDILGGLQMTWSPYVTGGLICLYCWFAVPVLYKFRRPYAYVAVDALALCGYLFLIAAMNNGMGWFFRLALPLVVLVGLAILGLFWSFRRMQQPMLHRVALGLAVVSLFLMALEVFTDLWARGKVHINWSIIAAIPLLVIALMCVYFERNEALKSEIRKRLFL